MVMLFGVPAAHCLGCFSGISLQASIVYYFSKREETEEKGEKKARRHAQKRDAEEITKLNEEAKVLILEEKALCSIQEEALTNASGSDMSDGGDSCDEQSSCGDSDGCSDPPTPRPFDRTKDDASTCSSRRH